MTDPLSLKTDGNNELVLGSSLPVWNNKNTHSNISLARMMNERRTTKQRPPRKERTSRSNFFP